MTITPDILYERKIVKSRMNRWKAISLILLFIILILIITDNIRETSADFIARVNIEGVMFENSRRAENIKSLAKNKYVKAVIFRINSPGGTSYGGEQLYNAIRLLANSKPTVSILGTVAASGGYMPAIACDYILAGKMSLTGSIGVLIQGFDTTELLVKKLGVTPYHFKTSEYKAAPNPFETVTPKVKDAIDQTIGKTFEVFKLMVKERRKLSDDELDKVADGRIFVGSQALELKLIDQIGDEEEAIEWLAQNYSIPNTLSIRDYYVDKVSNIKELLSMQSFKSFFYSLFTEYHLPMSLYK